MSFAETTAEFHVETVQEITKHFRAAVDAPTKKVAWHVGHAAWKLLRGSKHVMDYDQHTEMKFAIFAAAEIACLSLPGEIPRDQIRNGFRAFAQIADFWAAEDGERGCWGERIYDARDTAQILINHCHNAALANQVVSRQQSRQGELVNGLGRAANG